MAQVTDKLALAPLVDYDQNADVLYISRENPVPDEGEEAGRGVVFRYSVEGNRPVGVTIIGFKRNSWDKSLSDLVQIIGDRLNIEKIALRRAIESEIDAL